MADVIGIDFAPRHSAYAVLDSETAELKSFGNIDVGSNTGNLADNLGELLRWSVQLREQYSQNAQPLIVMEDVSHFMTNPAHALRLQGALRAFMWEEGMPVPEMVYPQVWQKFFGWTKTPGTTSKGFATFVCEVLGYTDLGVSKGKASEDVHDAILIARWRIELTRELGVAL